MVDEEKPESTEPPSSGKQDSATQNTATQTATLSFADDDDTAAGDDDFFSLFADINFGDTTETSTVAPEPVTAAAKPTPPQTTTPKISATVAAALQRPITQAEIDFCLSRWVAISISNPQSTPKEVPTISYASTGWIILDYGDRLVAGPGDKGRLISIAEKK